MVFPFTAITVVAQLVVAVADGVPNINYEKGCRASAAANASLGCRHRRSVVLRFLHGRGKGRSR